MPGGFLGRISEPSTGAGCQKLKNSGFVVDLVVSRLDHITQSGHTIGRFRDEFTYIFMVDLYGKLVDNCIPHMDASSEKKGWFDFDSLYSNNTMNPFKCSYNMIASDVVCCISLKNPGMFPQDPCIYGIYLDLP